MYKKFCIIRTRLNVHTSYSLSFIIIYTLFFFSYVQSKKRHFDTNHRNRLIVKQLQHDKKMTNCFLWDDNRHKRVKWNMRYAEVMGYIQHTRHMSPTETDIFFDRGVLKKADACGLFGVLLWLLVGSWQLCCCCGSCAAVLLSCAAVLSLVVAALLRSAALLNIILIIEQHLSTKYLRASWTRKILLRNALRCARSGKHLVSIRCADGCALLSLCSVQMAANGFKTLRKASASL